MRKLNEIQTDLRQVEAKLADLQRKRGELLCEQDEVRIEEARLARVAETKQSDERREAAARANAAR